MLERAGSEPIVDLATGDPGFTTPGYIRKAALLAVRQGETHYTHSRGAPALRRAFAEKLARENGLGRIDPDTEIVVTAGALNALAAVFQALLDSGDEVLVPDPGFANYRAQVLLSGGTPVPLRLRAEDGFLPSIEALREAATPRTRAIVVNSPANPTGVVFPVAVLRQVASFAAEHGLVLISDEAYEHLVYSPAEHVSLATLEDARPRTVSIFSMSKTYAMTGWRVGFAVAPAPVAEQVAKVQEHLIGCPSSVSQAAALAALTGSNESVKVMVDEYAYRCRLVVNALTGLAGIHLVRPQGAFYAFPSVGRSGREIAERLLAEERVLVLPGDAFGAAGANHVRVSFATETSIVEEGLRRLCAGLSQ
jgi:aspartate aminotransferase